MFSICAGRRSLLACISAANDGHHHRIRCTTPLLRLRQCSGSSSEDEKELCSKSSTAKTTPARAAPPPGRYTAFFFSRLRMQREKLRRGRAVQRLGKGLLPKDVEEDDRKTVMKRRLQSAGGPSTTLYSIVSSTVLNAKVALTSKGQDAPHMRYRRTRFGHWVGWSIPVPQ